MNHKNYCAYMMSKRKVIIIKDFEEIFTQLEYAYNILETEKEIFFVDQSGKTLVELNYEEGWIVKVESFEEVIEKWQIIKSHLGYIRPLFFNDNNGKVLAYVHGCWVVH